MDFLLQVSHSTDRERVANAVTNKRGRYPLSMKACACFECE